MATKYLTVVAAINDDTRDISIHVDQEQVRELGIPKTLYGYGAIQEHCAAVIASMIPELGAIGASAVQEVMKRNESAESN